MVKLTTIIGLLVVALFSCSQTRPNLGLEKIARLSKRLAESSGIEQLENSDDFWLINDAGNSNDLFCISPKGNIKQIVHVVNASNVDWEDIASDGKGKLFIGDFGNNANDRKNLIIYSVSLSDIKNNKVEAKIISFTFEDQEKFPPKKSKRNFDVEAFFYHNNYFYLWTKNRSSNYDGAVKLYRLSSVPGNHQAKLIGTFFTCDHQKKCLVTAADISSDGKQVALLTHNRLYRITNFDRDHFLEGTVEELKLHHNSQKEALCFGNKDDFYVTDERSQKTGGNLYRFNY